MKQGNNNEIDLLLRDLGRREPSLTAADSGAKPGARDQLAAHLDTDELNSYVEGVLPDAARVRYTAHLADCARCRDIVARLAPLTAASIHKREAQQESSVTWWQKLAAFLSPPVLRYAVPALALCAVVALGFMALRQQRRVARAEFVAQNQPSASSAPVGQAPSESLSQSAKTKAGESQGLTSGSEQQTRTETKAGTAQIAKSGSADDRTVATNEKAFLDARSKKDMPQSSAAGAMAQPSYAPEPAAPLAARETAAGEVDKLKEGEKAQAKPPQATTEAAVRIQSEADEKTRDRNEVVETQAGRKAESSSVARRSTRSLPAEEGRASGAALAKRDDNRSETRTVAGHHFRRQGNVWIDTAYGPSRSVIDVKRGSEQYRELVAEKPALRSIAEQLKGDVIVVWEDLAYRIH